jgi:nitrate reductase NapAB chaperone NapD
LRTVSDTFLLGALKFYPQTQTVINFGNVVSFLLLCELVILRVKMGEAKMGDSCPRIEAFILVTTTPGKLWKVVENASKILGVKLAVAVAGQFDVVIHVKTNDLSWVIARIHDLDGIIKTETLVSLEVHF